MSLNRVIGAGNKIPWHIPDDFKWFKKMTTGQIVVMGRKTFESIGKPLPNRETFILSRSGFSVPGVRTVPSLRDLPTDDPRQIWICGGAEIYAQALPLCSDLYLTIVQREVEGDAFFPRFEHLFDDKETVATAPDYVIKRFVSRSAGATG